MQLLNLLSTICFYPITKIKNMFSQANTHETCLLFKTIQYFLEANGLVIDAKTAINQSSGG